MLRKEGFTENNSMIIREFDRYVLEHPEFADKMPNNSLTELKPVRSRIEKLRLEMAS